MQSKNRNKEFAFYVVSLYRNGNYTETALFGCVMFEKAVYYLLETKGIDYYKFKELYKEQNITGKLYYATIKMCEFGYYKQKDIDAIRHIRNDIIHDKLKITQIKSDDINPMVKFIWEVLDPATYEEYNGKIKKINFKKADYAIRSMRRPLTKPISDEIVREFDFKWFQLNDFRELNELRKKFIALKSRINEKLLTKYYQDLKIDNISQVDTTSAYVWMGINFKDKKKSRIASASISILGTPLDLRIYMDFGGKALQARQDYYNFLKAKEFINFWKEHNIDKKEIRIFDIDWYCFIIKHSSLDEFLTTSNKEKQIAFAQDMLIQYEHDNNKIISWNRLLCGYIIGRQTISYEKIENKLKNLIDFYYCFKGFQESIEKINLVNLK